MVKSVSEYHLDYIRLLEIPDVNRVILSESVSNSPRLLAEQLLHHH